MTPACHRSVASLLVVASLAMPAAAAQDPPPPTPSTPPAAGTPPAADRPPSDRTSPPEPRPYERVITKEAASDTGVFTVHRIGERLFYEIPAAELGREFLWVSQIARTTLGAGQGGQGIGSRVVRWERRGNRVLLRSVAYDIVASRTEPIAQAVEAANNATVLMAFNIEAFGPDEAPVIDVTRLFTAEVTEFSARARVRSASFDAGRSFLERAVSFPENIEVEATHTYSSPLQVQNPSNPGNPNAPRPGSVSVVLHYSMVKLPEQPMMPRLFDRRIGYFNVQQIDYGRGEHRAERRRYITRWRLEKKDPSAAVSEPVKPIVFYVDPATPPKLVPFIKRGIESWRPAFEDAGFRNAITARDAPSRDDDPDWSAEDARYSVIRWLPSMTENAYGPHIADPRTGEIIEADIQIHHNVMNLVRDWYMVQVGPLDPRAARLPLPDDLMGRLIEFVVAHEVGHSLGFQHNMKASSTYPAEKIRDRAWVRKMGHTPSIMDYARFNYVAQPEDRIDIADLVPGIGPYDRWATRWGYRPLPEAATPDAEKHALDLWARDQESTPWLRFTTADSAGADPGELTEAVGDGDAVASTTQGVKNLERVAGMLLTATRQPGAPYDDLDQLYGRLLGQWVREMNHVAAVVGGVSSRQKAADQEGVRFVPIPASRQREAARFLNARAFATPAFLIKPEILGRIEAAGVSTRIKASQKAVLTTLLAESRLVRLAEQDAQATPGAPAYRPADFMADLRRGIWSELAQPVVRIDAYRRNLQRAYLEVLDDKLNGRQPAATDGRPLSRAQLREIDRQARLAAARAADAMTRAHLQDVRDQVARILNPPPGGARPAAPPGRTAAFEAFEPAAGGCWHDFAITRVEDDEPGR